MYRGYMSHHFFVCLCAGIMASSSSWSFPENFVAPNLPDKFDLLRGVNEAQHADLVTMSLAAIEEHKGVWNGQLEETMSALWAQFPVATIHWIVAYTRVILGLKIDCTRSSTKTEIVRALIKAEAPPRSNSEIKAFASKWKAWEGKGRPCAGEGNTEVMSAAGGADLHIDVSGASGGADAGPPPESTIQPTMATIVMKCIERLEKLEGSQPKSKTDAVMVVEDTTADDDELVPEQTPFDLHLSRIKRLLKNGSYVDPMQLCKTVLDKLRLRMPGEKKKSEKLGSLTISTRHSDFSVDTSAWFNPVSMREGFNKMVGLVLGIPEVHDRAVDLMEFFDLVWDHPCGSDENKCRFVKHVLFTYPRSVNLKKEAFGDLAFVQRFLQGPCGPDNAKRGGDFGAYEDTRRRRRSRSRDQDRANSGGKGQNRGDDKKRQKICFSRADKKVGECSWGTKCCFSHNCASCGSDHPASSCKNWDDAKGQSAKAAGGVRN